MPFHITGEEDLYDVFKLLTKLAAVWKAIGRALRLNAGELERIESAHPGKPTECLSDVILSWLRRNYDVKRFGLPTWRRIVEVVADPAAGNDTALANAIATKQSSIGKVGKLSNFTSVISALIKK